MIFPKIEEMVEWVQGAGQIICDVLASGDLGTEMKHDKTEVTRADMLANEHVLMLAHRAYPDISFYGEEQSRVLQRDGDLVSGFLLDPLDGTFIACRGGKEITVMLTYMEQGIPLMGVLYDPYTQDVVTVEAGKGVLLNRQPVTRQKFPDTIQESLISIMWWLDDEFSLKCVNEHLKAQDAVTIENFYSIGYIGLQILRGSCDASLFPQTAFLETALLDLIFQELKWAAIKCTDFFGNPLRPYRLGGRVQGHLICHSEIHSKMVSLFTSCQRA